MINKENFKDLLRTLNFKENGEVFSKDFSNEAYLKADFKKNCLIYPIDKGFKVNGDFTLNFSSDENLLFLNALIAYLKRAINQSI